MNRPHILSCARGAGCNWHHRVQLLYVLFKFETWTWSQLYQALPHKKHSPLVINLSQKPFSKQQTRLSTVRGDAPSCYSKDMVYLVWLFTNVVRICIIYPCVCMILETQMSSVCPSLAAFTAHHKQALTSCNGTVCMYSAWIFGTTVLTTRVILRVQLSTET